MFRLSVLVSVVAALASGVAFIYQLCLAAYLGTSDFAGALAFGLSLPATLSGVGMGVLSYVLIPLLNSFSEGKGREEQARAFEAWILFVGSVVTVIGIFWTLSISKGAESFSPNLRFSVKLIACISWLSVPIAWLGAQLSAEAQMRGRFLRAAAVQSLPTAGPMIACILWTLHRNIVLIALGQIIGFALIITILRPHNRWIIRGPAFSKGPWPGSNALAKTVLPAIIALSVFTIFPASDAYWGSRIAPSAIATLGYAQRISVGLSSVVIVGAVSVIFPELSRKVSRGDIPGMIATTYTSVRAVLTFTAPIAATLIAAPELFIRAALQRGAFGTEAASLLQSVLPSFMIGMVAMSGCGLIFKALFANHDVKVAAWIGGIGTILYFGGSGILATFYSIRGVASIYAVLWWLVLCAGVIHLSRNQKHLPAAFTRFLLKLAASSTGSYFVAHYIASINIVATIGALPALILVAAISVLSYLVIGVWIVHAEEVQAVFKHLKKKIAR